jgi:uncharacterized protein (TIGR03435 family)
MRLTHIFLASSLVGCAFSQAIPPSQGFEVASVKPHLGPMPTGGGKISVSGSRLTVEIYALSALITFAYDVKPYQVPGASALDHTYYDIVADAGDGRARTKDEFRPLMQALLADRFKLRVHLEDKEMPVYALVVDAKGPKLKASAAGAEPDAPREARGDWHSGATRGRAITRTCVKCTMQQFADIIRGNDGMDRPVVDKTGLTGTYEFELTYVPQNRMGGGVDSGPDAVDIFTAVKELGLRLEPQKSSVQFLIIDHSEKPAEN